MLDPIEFQIRQDCLCAASSLPMLAHRLQGHHLAVVGGLGFVGSWLGHMVAALNDEFAAGIKLTLIGRDTKKWRQQHPNLQRSDILLAEVDVRSAFEFPRDTTLVIHAAGHADPRVQASNPQRVYQSILFGLDNSLTAANRLEGIERFVNISSGLVAGEVAASTPVAENAIGVLDFKRLQNLYAEMRRAGEALASGYASQYRLAISTVRAFTFLGPFQALDAPWAVNNFIRDALSSHDIRVHGSGSSRRTYLYGSDVAAWLLQAALAGEDGGVYNLGGAEPVSHEQVAHWVSGLTVLKPRILIRTRDGEDPRSQDFYPDLTHSKEALGVRVTMDVRTAIERTMRWSADRQGLSNRLTNDPPIGEPSAQP